MASPPAMSMAFYRNSLLTVAAASATRFQRGALAVGNAPATPATPGASGAGAQADAAGEQFALQVRTSVRLLSVPVWAFSAAHFREVCSAHVTTSTTGLFREPSGRTNIYISCCRRSRWWRSRHAAWGTRSRASCCSALRGASKKPSGSYRRARLPLFCVVRGCCAWRTSAQRPPEALRLLKLALSCMPAEQVAGDGWSHPITNFRETHRETHQLGLWPTCAVCVR